MNKYRQYLEQLKKPFIKLAKIEFLQPDGSVAFFLDNNSKKSNGKYDSRAFIQSGELRVSLQNGLRRNAEITLSNLDSSFDYAINRLWFGQQIRLSMGLKLSDGTDFYLPQGVFYINTPTHIFSPYQKTATLPLVDKWAYLDGSLFGNLEGIYRINAGTDIFEAVNSVLSLSKYTFEQDENCMNRIDATVPVFTTYYDGKTYKASDSDGTVLSDIKVRETPYTLTTSSDGSFADVLLKLNDMLVGIIGYDCTGALRIEPSQDDITDYNKPVLWNFSPKNSNLITISESTKNEEIYNDIIVVGEGLSGSEVWGRASNYDPSSDTNINIIGKHIKRISSAEYWNTEQCVNLAKWHLKRKTVLQKSITIESSQLFHLIENRLISVTRTDKSNTPTEKHLIQSFTLPISQAGSMTINAVSVNDIPNFTVKSSTSS